MGKFYFFFQNDNFLAINKFKAFKKNINMLFILVIEQKKISIEYYLIVLVSIIIIWWLNNMFKDNLHLNPVKLEKIYR